MRILVVEDEKNMNRLISEAMKDEKYSVDSCFEMKSTALTAALTGGMLWITLWQWITM